MVVIYIHVPRRRGGSGASTPRRFQIRAAGGSSGGRAWVGRLSRTSIGGGSGAPSAAAAVGDVAATTTRPSRLLRFPRHRPHRRPSSRRNLLHRHDRPDLRSSSSRCSHELPFDRPHLVVRHELPFDRPHPVVRHELPFDRPYLILVRRCHLVRNRPAVQLLNGLVSQSREDAAFHVAALPAGQVVLERARGHGSRVRGVHHLEPPVHRADVAVIQVILGGRRRSARWAAAVARSDGDDEQVGEFGDARIPEVAGNVPRVRPRDDAIVQYDKVLPTQSRRVYVEPRGLHRQGARLLRHEGVIRFEDGTAVDFDAPQRGQIPQSPFGVRDVHDVFEQGRGSGRHALVRGAGHHQIRRVALEVRREEALERPVDLRGVVPARGRRSVLEFRVSFGRELVLPRVEAAHEIDPTQGFIVMVPFDGIDGMLFDDHRFGFGSPPSTTRGHYLLRNAAHPK